MRVGALVPSPEVLDGSQDQRLVFVEGTQRSVAAIAEDSSDLPGGVIVVHLDRWLASADRFFVPVVVTGPAIGGTPVPRVLVATEGVERLYLAAVRAPLPGRMGSFGSPRLPLHRTSVRMATDKNWPILSPDEEGLGGE